MISFLQRVFRLTEHSDEIPREKQRLLDKERERTKFYWDRLRELEKEAELETRKPPNPDYDEPGLR